VRWVGIACLPCLGSNMALSWEKSPSSTAGKMLILQLGYTDRRGRPPLAPFARAAAAFAVEVVRPARRAIWEAVPSRPAKAPAPTLSTNSSPATTAKAPTRPPSGAHQGIPAKPSAVGSGRG